MIGTAIVPVHKTSPTAPARNPLPALFAPDARAAERFVAFFTAHVRNTHTRMAFPCRASLRGVVRDARHRDAGRQSHLARDRDHCLSQARRPPSNTRSRWRIIPRPEPPSSTAVGRTRLCSTGPRKSGFKKFLAYYQGACLNSEENQTHVVV